VLKILYGTTSELIKALPKNLMENLQEKLLLFASGTANTFIK